MAMQVGSSADSGMLGRASADGGMGGSASADTCASEVPDRRRILLGTVQCGASLKASPAGIPEFLELLRRLLPVKTIATKMERLGVRIFVRSSVMLGAIRGKGGLVRVKDVMAHCTELESDDPEAIKAFLLKVAHELDSLGMRAGHCEGS